MHDPTYLGDTRAWLLGDLLGGTEGSNPTRTEAPTPSDQFTAPAETNLTTPHAFCTHLSILFSKESLSHIRSASGPQSP